jgi:hypothetical protein
MGWKTRSVFLSLQGLGSEATRPPAQWVPEDVSGGLKREDNETDHSPPFTVEVEKAGCLHGNLSTGATLPFTFP